MKPLIGLLLVLSGIVLGIYVGVVLCLVGGIVQVIEGAKATPVEAWSIAWGIARFLCAGLAGWLAAMILILPGAAMIKS
jgi:hypothetical protein